MSNKSLYFLKLGGSLITDKDNPHTARKKTLFRLSEEIKHALDDRPEIQLLIGHGSGSFGHNAAHKHQTRMGVQNPQQWLGFIDVWRQARDLNEIVLESLQKAGLPVMSFPPSSSVTATNGKVESWDLNLITLAIQNRLVPVIYGDVIFDTKLGGTILSTEELFFHLALNLHPSRILLAGLENGVWEDYPLREKMLEEITPESIPTILHAIQGSASVDVTGGMADKVAGMLKLISEEPQIKISIFSGMKSGVLKQAFADLNIGTLIHQGNQEGQGK